MCIPQLGGAPPFILHRGPSSNRLLETSLPLAAHLPPSTPAVLLSSILITSVCSLPPLRVSCWSCDYSGTSPAAWQSQRFRCPSFFVTSTSRAASTPPAGQRYSNEDAPYELVTPSPAKTAPLPIPYVRRPTEPKLAVAATPFSAPQDQQPTAATIFPWGVPPLRVQGDEGVVWSAHASGTSNWSTRRPG